MSQHELPCKIKISNFLLIWLSFVYLIIITFLDDSFVNMYCRQNYVLNTLPKLLETIDNTYIHTLYKHILVNEFLIEFSKLIVPNQVIAAMQVHFY